MMFLITQYLLSSLFRTHSVTQQTSKKTNTSAQTYVVIGTVLAHTPNIELILYKLKIRKFSV
jgi:hypothetical protein